MKDTKQIELTLLTLAYERQVSRSHTIFACFWDIFFGIIVGSISIVLGLIEVGVMEFHRLNFIIIIIIVLSITGIVGIVASYKWYESKMERNKIEKSIKNILTTQLNQP